jgi:hypothetical protein
VKQPNGVRILRQPQRKKGKKKKKKKGSSPMMMKGLDVHRMGERP